MSVASLLQSHVEDESDVIAQEGEEEQKEEQKGEDKEEEGEEEEEEGEEEEEEEMEIVDRETLMNRGQAPPHTFLENYFVPFLLNSVLMADVGGKDHLLVDSAADTLGSLCLSFPWGTYRMVCFLLSSYHDLFSFSFFSSSPLFTQTHPPLPDPSQPPQTP